MAKHAILSPSSSKRWSACPGSVRLSEGIPNVTSDFADEGTAAHFLASTALERKVTARMVGQRVITYLDLEGKQDWAIDFEPQGCKVLKTYQIADLHKDVQVYVDLVNEYASDEGASLLIEVTVPIDHITGEESATGTSDAIIVLDYGDGTAEVTTIDLKFGKGVLVEAEDNSQLMMYSSGAIRVVEEVMELRVINVKMIISQPRASVLPSEVGMRREDLDENIARLSKAALRTYQPDAPVNPGKEQCRFCLAKSSCPALAKESLETVFTDLDADLPQLKDSRTQGLDIVATWYPKLEMIEAWCAGVRGRMYSELTAGAKVPGYKLVQGKRGNREWDNKEEVEALMKSMRIKEVDMYSQAIISPTKAETLLKEVNPRRWAKLEERISRSDGKPTVALETDPRAAITTESFDDLDAVNPLD